MMIWSFPWQLQKKDVVGSQEYHIILQFARTSIRWSRCQSVGSCAAETRAMSRLPTDYPPVVGHVPAGGVAPSTAA